MMLEFSAPANLFELVRTAMHSFSRARAALLLFGATLVMSHPASAQCANPREMGLWQNEAAEGDPFRIQSRMVECGDSNTQPNITYKVTAIVKQSTGNFYHRPAVWGRYVRWTLNNQRGQWFEADVSTGGY
jgi:hypothetical protein